MRVIRVRAWVRRALWTWLALLGALVALLSLTEPEIVPVAQRSPRRHQPVFYWNHRETYPKNYVRSGCISPPSSAQDLQHAAAFWQHVMADETQVLVFAAYWDDRVPVAPLVRLLVYKVDSTIKLRCLFWYYDRGDPVSVGASLPDHEGLEYHQVVSCAPPTTPARDDLAAVSLVTADFQCGMTRNLLVIQNRPASVEVTPGPASDPRLEGARIGVCIVWWRTGDAATRLAEWLQLLRYFGVHRVFIYINNKAHVNVLRVLDLVSWQANLDQMTVDVMPYASPPLSASTNTEAPNTNSRPRDPHADFDEYSDDYKQVNVSDSAAEINPDIRAEDLLPYNECVYRALGERLVWLAVLDVDEIILPVRDGTWDRLAMKESRAAKFSTDELADVLDFQRWWFPEMLQVNLTSPAPPIEPDQLSSQQPTPGPGVLWSPRPSLAVPPGRIFEYKWSGPTARADATVRGKLLRLASIWRVRSQDVTCLGSCQTRVVDSEVARVHLYTKLCGEASRGVCRALRRVAVRTYSDAIWKWRRAQQEAAILLRRIKLMKHEHSDRDDE